MFAGPPLQKDKNFVYLWLIVHGLWTGVFQFIYICTLFCVSDCSYQRQRDYWVARAQNILLVVNIHLHQRYMLSQGQVLNDNSQELILKASFWCTLQCRVYVCPLWVDIKWQTSHLENFTLWKLHLWSKILQKMKWFIVHCIILISWTLLM